MALGSNQYRIRLLCLLRLSRIRFFSAPLTGRLRNAAHIALAQDSEWTQNFLLSELMHSKNIRQSVIILWLLKDIVVRSSRELPVLESTFKDLPGGGALEKLLLCQRVLHSCFSIDCFDGELQLEIFHVSSVSSPAATSDTAISIEDLNAQHEAAFADWLRRHNLNPPIDETSQKAFAMGLKTEADAGDCSAKYLLAVVYSDGFGVPQDFSKSLELLREAANLGNPNAQSTLGIMHCVGFIAEMNLDTGKVWLTAAAAQGNAVAQITLRKIQVN